MKLYLLLILFYLPYLLYSQEIITGRSRPKKFNFKTAYKKAAPPDLYVSFNFTDENNNNVLEVNETAYLNLNIDNRGSGPAQGLVISFNNETNDQEISIPRREEISFVFPGKPIDISIPIKASKDIRTLQHKVKIQLKDFYDNKADPASLVFNSYEKKIKNATCTGYKIDNFFVLASKIRNNTLPSGTEFTVNFPVKNIGQVECTNLQYKFSSTNKNIIIDPIQGTINTLSVGSSNTIKLSIKTSKDINTEDKLELSLEVKDENYEYIIEDFKIELNFDKISGGSETFPEVGQVYDFEQNEAYFEYDSKKNSDYVGKIYDLKAVKKSLSINSDDVAVLIGIEKYQSLIRSPRSVSDALTMRNYFQKRLGIRNIKLYNNREAADSIFDYLIFKDYAYLKNNIKANKSNLFIYFSGHCVPTGDGNDLFLIPYGCTLNSLSNCAVKLSDIINKLKEYQPKTINLIVEASMNGKTKQTPFKNSEKIKPNSPQINMNNLLKSVDLSNVNLVFASGPDSKTLTFEPSETGLMTYLFCAGMQGYADQNSDKKITFNELVDFVMQETLKASEKINGKQIPYTQINKDFKLFDY